MFFKPLWHTQHSSVSASDLPRLSQNELTQANEAASGRQLAATESYSSCEVLYTSKCEVPPQLAAFLFSGNKGFTLT